MNPTGEQWRIEADGYAARVVETGATLAELTYEDRHLLAGVPEGEAISAGRGQLLLPWPNRIRDGRYTFAGTEQQLALSEPSRHNASHGLSRWVAWHPLEVAADRVRLGCRLMAQSGYPWTLDLTVDYAVSRSGLSVTVAATNRADGAAPFAAGVHPYLSAGTVHVDDATVTVPADTHQLVDDRLLPRGTEPADETLRRGLRIGDTRLDDAFTGLARDADGWAVVRLDGEWPVELRMDGAWRWVQLFTGDGLPTGARNGLAVEPMTAPADAFNSGTDLVVLDPGETWSGTFAISSAAER